MCVTLTKSKSLFIVAKSISPVILLCNVMLWPCLGHQLTDTQLANARTFSAEKRSKFQEYKGFLFCIELQRTGKKITLTVETL